MRLSAPTGPVRRAPLLRQLDLAYGVPLGFERLDVLPLGSPEVDAITALTAVMLEALQRAPCVVSFSGGRDSSALLALAQHVARTHALPAPIPATLLFPGVAAADEDKWQRTVLNHLKLSEWLRIPVA